MRQFSLPSAAFLSLLLLQACGADTVTEQPQPEASTLQERVAPDVGEPAPPAETPSPPALPETAPEDSENSISSWMGINEGGFEEILWEDLMPPGEEERLLEMYQMQMSTLYSMVLEGSPADKAQQFGTFNVVEEMDGLKIRIPGYTVPFDFGPNAQITEFLLVPYFGACLHAPPPPPNQTLYVTTENAIKISDLAQAVWIEGTLRTQKQTSELADTAYTVEMENIEEYSY